MTRDQEAVGVGRSEPRVGVDIGRVLIAGPGIDHSGDTAFFDGDEAAMLATPEVAGAVDAIARLVDALDGRVWLVSKCGRRIQDRTTRWLAAHDVVTRTGLAPDHVRFCRTRPDKRLHCEELRLTHFVDDHPDVHRAIRGAVRHQYLFGAARTDLDDVVPVPTWDVALARILATLPAPFTPRSG